VPIWTIDRPIRVYENRTDWSSTGEGLLDATTIIPSRLFRGRSLMRVRTYPAWNLNAASARESNLTTAPSTDNGANSDANVDDVLSPGRRRPRACFRNRRNVYRIISRKRSDQKIRETCRFARTTLYVRDARKHLREAPTPTSIPISGNFLIRQGRISLVARTRISFTRRVCRRIATHRSGVLDGWIHDGEYIRINRISRGY